MSGGRFNYNQYSILDIAEDIEREIQKSGRKKKYPQDLYYHKYPDEVIEKFKEGVKAIKIAYVYAHRIDWLLSGDDGEESFLERLEQELKQIQDK